MVWTPSCPSYFSAHSSLLIGLPDSVFGFATWSPLEMQEVHVASGQFKSKAYDSPCAFKRPELWFGMKTAKLGQVTNESTTLIKLGGQIAGGCPQIKIDQTPTLDHPFGHNPCKFPELY